MLTAAAGAAAALVPAPVVGAQPADEPSAVQRSPYAAHASPVAVGARVDRLYAQAEAATEKYNATAERAARLREQAEHLQESAARGRSRVNRLRGALAALAGAQYRGGGVDPAVTLILSADPDSYLDKAATLDRITSRQDARLDLLRGAQRSLAQRRTEAALKLAQLQRQQKALRQHKQSVRQKLAAARRLLNQLSPEERAERERASRERGRAGAEGVRGGPGTRDARRLPGPGGPPASSGRAAAAVAAVRSAVGAPYVWGATGPGSFDCSGLTQWAYRRAGIAIPRTSQGQRSAGRRVSLSAARPGDLVVYRSDASHVAMYVGGGRVVHAPHPGARVRDDPVGMMPVSSVTRP